jgi:hypothetical protein
MNSLSLVGAFRTSGKGQRFRGPNEFFNSRERWGSITLRNSLRYFNCRGYAVQWNWNNIIKNTYFEASDFSPLQSTIRTLLLVCPNYYGHGQVLKHHPYDAQIRSHKYRTANMRHDRICNGQQCDCYTTRWFNKWQDLVNYHHFLLLFLFVYFTVLAFYCLRCLYQPRIPLNTTTTTTTINAIQNWQT